MLQFLENSDFSLEIPISIDALANCSFEVNDDIDDDIDKYIDDDIDDDSDDDIDDDIDDESNSSNHKILVNLLKPQKVKDR